MLNEAYTVRFFYRQEVAKGEVLNLSVFLAADTFMYAISTRQFTKITELCHIQLSTGNAIATDYNNLIEILVKAYFLHQKKFDKVQIAVLNREFTLVPAAFAAGEDLKPLLHFATGASGLKNLVKHTIKEASFCFHVNQDLRNYLENIFPNASIRHSGAIAINLLFSQHSLKNCTMLLQVGSGFIELAARKGGNLLFYNVFKYEGNEDILYYLLFIMEQFELNPLDTVLGVAGERPADDELIKSIKKYIRKVEFCVHQPGIELPQEVAKQPAHYYFTLLNQHVCEL